MTCTIDGWRDQGCFGGSPLTYRGILAKRAAPGIGDYLAVPGGYRASARFRLADNYDVAASGSYQVVYKTRLVFSTPGSGCDLRSNRVTVRR